MLEFKDSAALTLGVELELQLVNRHDFNLTRAATDLLTRLNRRNHGFDIKPEITESMIEIATGIHTDIAALHNELTEIQNLLLTETAQMNIGICGGGAHPFQHWEERRIYEAERYRLVSELYGYLAKQFTVYGQHIHVGCPTADWAIQLTNELSKYLPDFIALSASSPFYQGVDTGFQSSRLIAVDAFPLSGKMPGFSTWTEFSIYFDSMQNLGIVKSMKDFYWDLRPKPEYGTVEIRVCDAPLTIGRAVVLAAYAQTLAAHIFSAGDIGMPANPNLDKVHSYNRFQACRFGLQAIVIDPDTGQAIPLAQRIQATIAALGPLTERLRTREALDQILQIVMQYNEESTWLREIYMNCDDLSEVVYLSTERWKTRD